MAKDKNSFEFVEYSAEAAERIGYSDYSYWGSVMKNFLKKITSCLKVKTLQKRL